MNVDVVHKVLEHFLVSLGFKRNFAILDWSGLAAEKNLVDLFYCVCFMPYKMSYSRKLLRVCKQFSAFRPDIPQSPLSYLPLHRVTMQKALSKSNFDFIYILSFGSDKTFFPFLHPLLEPRKIFS
uniref:Uncharacterized protein n=1 Tax=Micrurus carvalhoi TaxID=3147026 RepID=A0A2H6N238_9SAUR